MSSSRAALFDLAVARADAYTRRARVPPSDGPAALTQALEVWQLKTRFASRVPLELVARALAARPAGEGWIWRGGPEGEWRLEAPPGATRSADQTPD